MKKFLLIALICLSLIVPVAAFSATPGTCTVSYASLNAYVSTITWTWVASVDAATVPDTSSASLNGWIFMATTDPGAGVPPTASYDIEVQDSDGVDIFGAELNNRSQTASEHAVPKIGTGYYGSRFVNGTLKMVLTGNSVNSATGTLKVYFTRTQ